MLSCRRLSVTDENSESPGCLLGVAEDITEKRAARLQLHKNQLLLKMAGRAARLGGWTFDSSSQHLHWSDEICEMHGYPPGYRPTLAQGISHTTCSNTRKWFSSWSASVYSMASHSISRPS